MTSGVDRRTPTYEEGPPHKRRRLHKLDLEPNAFGVLNISNQEISKLPKGLRKIEGIVTLILNHNPFGRIPAALGKMNITTLHLRGCNIHKISGPLPQTIEYLNLSENPIKEVPAAVLLLPRLKSLILRSCPNLVRFEETEETPAIQTLDLSKGALTELPPAVLTFNELESLDLGHSAIERLPDDMSRLTKLATLNLSHSQICELPPSLNEIVSLRNLSAQGTLLPSHACQEVLRATAILREEIKSYQTHIRFWNSHLPDHQKLPDVPEQRRKMLIEWFNRVDETGDYLQQRRSFLSTVAKILHTAFTDEEFGEIFFGIVSGDLVNCQDRTAQSLNLIYTEWKLHTLPKDAPLKRKVNILLSWARTLRLRQSIEVDYSDAAESVEIYLAAEVILRNELKLLTLSRSMYHDSFASRVDLDTYAKAIKETPNEELLADLETWRDFLREEKSSEVAKIDEARTALLTRMEKGEISEGDYLIEDPVLTKEMFFKLTKAVLDEIGSLDA
ncbi:MAG: hypothetical protein S4CHLAM81_07630 [Chlamydiales bacterium]|nr:hypothetical protein [Chlamydiales bacterium]MCH9635545.1 hypothetical protein [Chlamydiales bacterium]MCH9703673.1 hypothetical protein [Chlamydiota bacterium]